MPSGVSWHLSSKLLFSRTNLVSPRQFSLNELILSIWHLSKEEWKISLSPELKKRGRQRERERWAGARKRARRWAMCRAEAALSWRASVFLSSPINLMPEGGKRRKRDHFRSYLLRTNMTEHMKYENSTNYLNAHLVSWFVFSWSFFFLSCLFCVVLCVVLSSERKQQQWRNLICFWQHNQCSFSIPAGAGFSNRQGQVEEWFH